MLKEFFHTNNTSSEAKTLSLTYNEFPDHFVWVATDRRWKLRQRNTSVGRIVTVHPTDGERYFLRILLRKVRCPLSYTDLQTYNGVLYPTFRAAALARGFLDNDDTQESCLREASLFHMPYELRRLFSTMLVHACPSDPKKLWTLFEPNMSEDFRLDCLLTPAAIRMKVLQQLSDFLQSMGIDINSFGLLPSGFHFNVVSSLTRELDDERSIQVSFSDLRSVQFLNASQLIIYNKVLEKISSNQPGAFFVDGPGRTGKTFLYRALLANVRSKGNIALATASSGIAASLLPGGRTAHSRFKIPIDLVNSSTCRVSKQSGLALLIIECKLIIWDEAPMSNKDSIEAVDNLLRDLLSSDVPFGGKVIILGGDFRQTLSVVRYGSKTATLAACLKSSHIWPKLEKLSLTENMRALTDPEFTSYLLNVGNGAFQTQDFESVEIPASILLPISREDMSLENLILQVFPDFSDFFAATTHNKVILTTKNTFVEEINNLLISKFPGSAYEYLSYDRVLDDSNEGQYEDLINTLTPNGLPLLELCT